MPEQSNIWLWDAANSVWVEASVVVVTKRMTDTGQVITGAHRLYWVNSTPSAGNSVLEVTDDTDGLSAIIYDCFHTTRESHVHNLNPPMPFSNGIYIKTLTNYGSVIFGYV
ncbi:hypothetical protein LCGC14_2096130 [marine sediment metagenome]|uniref:Uncharacterized protein n=1 Tax=marine sediment metagenome TaxID=412755 RepID=A0A0F9EBJ2_9ZZZZ